MKGFDKHLKELIDGSPELRSEYSKAFAELPLPTQLAVMRRRRKLSQRAVAKKLKLTQPHIARTERASHDPRLSSIQRAAKAIRCHLILVPDEHLSQ